LSNRSRVLVLTHQRPDGDAFGALFGMVLGLCAAGKEAHGYLATALPERYARFFPEAPVYVGTPPPIDNVDGVLCLDTSNSARIEAPEGLPNPLTMPLCNIDHHGDNEQYGECVWVDARAAATAEMLTSLLSGAGWLTSDVATCLLTGLIMDTGGFRFGNTSPEVLHCAARLTAVGGRYHETMDSLFFREPRARRALEAELVSGATFAHEDRLVYAVLYPERIRELGLGAADLEGLIDVIRTIDGVEIACLVQPEEDGIRLSLRSRSPRFPVQAIARTLGGGGHTMAAGAKMEGASLADAEHTLLDLTRKVLTDNERTRA